MLLAVDTSTRAIGVALFDGNRVLSEASWVSKSHHTVELAPAVEEALARVGASVRDVEAVGVAIGPGGFTGLRIGLALAKGLVLSRRIPLIGLSTLDCLAAAQPLGDFTLAAVLEAGRKRLAVGWYRAEGQRWRPTRPPVNCTLDDLIAEIHSPTWVCGELTAEARQRLAREAEGVILASPSQSLRRPAVLAELAWERWRAGQVDDPATLKPIYLHHGEPIPG